MGNSPSYAKIATVSWYREGSKNYGQKGYDRAKQHFTDLIAARRDDGKQLLDGRSVLVTGSNQGIGFHAALQCAQLGAHVHLLVRTPAKGEEAAEDIRKQVPDAKVDVHRLDVSDFDAVRDFAHNVVPAAITGKADGSVPPPRPIHVLVNNAGCMPNERQTTKQDHEMIIATTMGGVLLTHLLLPYMARDGRIVNVASGGQYTVAPRVGDLDLPELSGKAYDGTLIYAYGKRWQVQLTYWMAKHASQRYAGVGFYSMHPGWAETAGVRNAMASFAERQEKNDNKLRSPGAGADTVTFLAAATPAMLKAAVEASEYKHAEKINPGSDVPANGGFWFDRAVVEYDYGFGTSWDDEWRAKLATAAASYVGVPDLTPL